MTIQAALHLLLLVILSLLASSTPAQEKPRPSYSLRMDQALHGTVDKSKLASGAPYPLNKRYEHFTAEERDVLRSYYEGMPQTDEPPFPLDGMRHIIADIAQVAGQLRAEGSVTLFVRVNEVGDATSVQLLGNQNLEAAKAVAYVLVRAKYKPAKCSGTPCALDFPFRIFLSTQ